MGWGWRMEEIEKKPDGGEEDEQEKHDGEYCKFCLTGPKTYSSSCIWAL